MKTVIHNSKEFFEIARKQNRTVMFDTKEELKESTRVLDNDSKAYTVFTLHCADNKYPDYFTQGISAVDVVGYYLLEGNLELAKKSINSTGK